MTDKLTRKEVVDLCKGIHIRNAEMYFKTKEFDNWVDVCHKLNQDIVKDYPEYKELQDKNMDD